MDSRERPSPLLGFWASIAFLVTTAAYLVALVVMMATGGDDPAVEPWATVFNVLNLVAPLIGVPIWCSAHLLAPARARAYTLSACVFAAGWAASVTINRFIGMTLVPQSTRSGDTQGLEWFLTYSWPSATRAIEMLGWGVFFALSCLFLAAAFTRAGLERAIAITLALIGVLSFIGATIGLAIDSETLMGTIAPIGWGAGPAVAAALLAIWFHRQPRAVINLPNASATATEPATAQP
ncbi:hypothetical protein [Phytohabitans kaempferiae]|uniref:DUF4386 family protein n=1 Tax=Phytohabitans kaempferiae TaxID=1620943 RepID=A0ABV6MFE2_9ACTN